MSETLTVTPFDRLGGRPVLEAVVGRFYDLVDSDPAYADLRAMHAADLGPMRKSLAGFLAGWLGGPRDWFDEHPGVCMMSAHAMLPVTDETAAQWTAAMRRALADCRVEPLLAGMLNDAFGRMAARMAA